jgi:hypothetical protein
LSLNRPAMANVKRKKAATGRLNTSWKDEEKI